LQRRLDLVRDFFHLFVAFARSYGLARALLRVIVWAAMGMSVPRHERIASLRFGRKMALIPDDAGISAELRLFKIHEPLASRVLMGEVKEDMVVVDIGSNIGYYVTLESGLVGPKGKVIAVEPSLVNFSYLVKNIELNKLGNVIAINKAISDKNGIAKFITSTKSNWSRILQSCRDLVAQDVKGVTETEVITLDSLVEQLQLEKIDLIRMDVEGYEDRIIGYSEKTLRRYTPDIFVEIHKFLLNRDRFLWLLNRLNDIGYDVKYFIPRNVDFAFVGRDSDIIAKNLGELTSCSLPDVFSVYLMARHAQSVQTH
jgi:FkbM family methyltransferase